MTTPNQPLPSSLESLLGIGAFQVADGGSTNYGQSGIDQSFIRSLVAGPATSLADVFDDIPAFLAELANFLTQQPLDSLQMFQKFIPGKTIATDFPDKATSVSTIMDALDVGNTRMNVDTWQGFLDLVKGSSGGTTTDFMAKLASLLPFDIFNQRQTTGTNLVISPGFEDTTFPVESAAYPLTGSEIGTGSYSTEQAHSGTHSYKLECPNTFIDDGYSGRWMYVLPSGKLSSGESDLTALWKVQPGQKYYFEAWVFPKATNTTGPTHGVSLTGNFYDAAGGGGFSQGLAAKINNPTVGQWTKLSGYLTVPAGAYYMALAADGFDTAAATDNVYYYDDIIVREETGSQNIIGQLFGGSDILSTILAGNIPGLDASKITSGSFSQSMITGLTSALAALVSGTSFDSLLTALFGGTSIGSTVQAGAIPGLDASKITSGAFDQSMISGLLSAFQSRDAAGSNLVLDPGFTDSTVTRYGAGSRAYSTTQAHSATYSYKLTGVNAEWDIIGQYGNASQAIKVNPGDKFYMEAWLYRPSTNSGTGQLFFQMDWRDSANAYLAGGGPFNAGQSTLATDTWTKVSAYVTAPAGAVYGMPYIGFNAFVGASDVLYIDDAVIREVTESQNIIQQLFGGTSVGSTVQDSAIPTLAQSKITGLISDLASKLGSGDPLDAANLFNLNGINSPLNATYSQSSVFAFSGVVAASMANMTNGNAAELYATGTNNTGPGNFIKMDLGSSQYVEHVVVGYDYQNTLGAGDWGPANTQGFNLQASNDDSSWTDVGVVPDYNSSAAAVIDGLVSMPVKGTWRYIRLYYAGSAWLAATEFAAYGSQIPYSRISGITDLGNKLSGTLSSLFGGPSIGSSILASRVPALDASKITSGTFSNSFVPGIGALTNIFNRKATSGSNLVIEPTFEDTSIARYSDGSYSTDQAHSGTTSWKMVALAGSYNDFQLAGYPTSTPVEPIATRPGQSFYIEGWVYPKATNTHSHVMIYVAFTDSTGVNSTTFGGVGDSSPTIGQWTKLSGYVTVPTGYDRAVFVCSVRNDNSTGDTFYWDDIIVREETASQNIIQQLFGGSSIGSSILASNVPALDASKITSGSFGQSQVSNLVSDLAGKTPLGFFNAQQLGGANLFIGPDFEDSSVQRTSSGVYSTEDKHSGTQSQKFVATGSQINITLNPVPTTDGWNKANGIRVQPGEKYYLEMWVKGKSTNTGGGGVGIWNYFSDSASSSEDWNTGEGWVDNVAGGFAWTKVSGYATVPAGMDRFIPYMYNNTSMPAGDVFYIDDVLIREVTGSTVTNQSLFGANTPGSSILAAAVPSLDASKITSGTVGDDRVPLVVSLWNALTGNAESSVTTAATSSAISDLASTTAALSGAVAALQTSSDGTTNSGLSGGDLFDVDYGSNLGGTGEWTETYDSGTSSNGFMYTSGGEARWSPAGSSARYGIFRRTNPVDAVTLTDYQKVTGVIGSQVADQVPGGPYCHSKILTRVKSDLSQYVFVKFTATGGPFIPMSAQFGYKNGGSETLVGSAVNCTQSAAATFDVISGTAGGVNFHQLRRNGTVILTWNDSGALAASGSNNRGWGFAQKAEVYSGNQKRPSSWAALTVSDNTPATVLGTGLDVYRSNTATVSVSSGDQQIPNSFFDTVVSKSTDITWDASTSTATIVTEGWYAIDFALTSAATMAAGNSGTALLYINGSAARYGTGFINAGFSAITTVDQHYTLSTSKYLTAGTTLRPGSWRSGSTHDFAGDAAGKKSWFQVVRTSK